MPTDLILTYRRTETAHIVNGLSLGNHDISVLRFKERVPKLPILGPIDPAEAGIPSLRKISRLRSSVIMVY